MENCVSLRVLSSCGKEKALQVVQSCSNVVVFKAGLKSGIETGWKTQFWGWAAAFSRSLGAVAMSCWSCVRRSIDLWLE